MSQGLSVGRLVNVVVNLSPKAASRANLGVLLVAGDSDVIDTAERIRSYTDLESVASDFGVNASEYKAAALYYAQMPRPLDLMIGRWARTATAGLLVGSTLTAEEQDTKNWNAAVSTFKVSIDGKAATDITCNLSGCSNLNAVAAKINTALGADAGCIWNGSAFKITSKTTGTSSSVGYLSKAATGTDISAQMKMTTSTAARKIDGAAGETAVECVAALANVSNVWRGLMFAASVQPDITANLAIALMIEGMAVGRVFGVADSDTQTLDPQYEQDTASQLKKAKYNRSFVQYSQVPFAVASLFGRAFSVDYSQPGACITLMYKQEPGVKAELLTETQAKALDGKNCNVFAFYDNDTAILQNGTCASGVYLDEMLGLDWFVNAVQNALFNTLYTAATKIPQTDEGQNTLVGVVSSVCGEAVTCGLLAGGTWNADGFGQLKRGAFLSDGFYVYTPPMATQDQATREQRIAPPIKIAAKLAGAIHKINATINVNR